MTPAKPLFVVSVDTEEDGLWSGAYPRHGHTVQNIEHLPALWELLREYRFKGTYLVTYPVAADARCRDILGEAVAGEGGEIGTHLHSWSCPPHEDVEDWLPLFPHCLPPDLQQRKLESLRDAILEAWQKPPVSYRAGRWGFDASSVPPLVRTGHLVDSSVVPGWWQKGRGAPAFQRAPRDPYLLDAHDALRPGRGPLLEVPVTTGFPGAPRGLERAARWIPSWLPGGRTAMEAARYTILRPALHDAGALVRLTRQAVASERPVLNLMLHSSELAPGHSPYSRDEKQRDGLLARLRAVLETAIEEGQAESATLADVHHRLRP